MTPLVTEVLRQYDERFPGARDARANDQWSYYARSLIGQTLASADWVLENEGIDERVRYRVLTAMALGGLSPVDAEMRQQQEERFLRAYETQAVPRVIAMPTERFEAWREQAADGG
jgi:hypothetical protein